MELSSPLLGTIVIFTISLLIVFKIIFNRISQLSHQNRLLKALRSLDIVALSTVEIEPLTQAIVDVVHKELGYFFAIIALVDDKLGGVRRVAISYNPVVEKIIASLPVSYKEQIVPASETENYFIKVINEKKSTYTSNLYDIQRGVLSPEVSQNIQGQLKSIFDLRGIFIYPLIAKNRVIGVIAYPITVSRERLSKFEYTIMEEFTNEVARVMENVILYETLRETSKQLAQANEKLKELDKLKDEFVSIASHELRTPMTAIKSYAWMALNKPDVPLTEKMKKYLERTLQSTERLINLVSDMLNVSRIEAGRIEISPKPFDMVELTKDVVDEVSLRARERGIKIQVLETKIPKVFADPDKVHEVLLNLVGNSLKFTPAGGSISVSFFSDGQVVETSVKDSGAGIAKEDLSRLFQKFERLDNSYIAVSTSGGTGLGLYISKSLVGLMHGRIWVHSEGLNKGSTFTFSLPVASQEVMEHPEKYHIKPEGEIKGLEPVAI